MSTTSSFCDFLYLIRYFFNNIASRNFDLSFVKNRFNLKFNLKSIDINNITNFINNVKFYL